MIKYTISLMLQVFFVTKLKSEKKKKIKFAKSSVEVLGWSLRSQAVHCVISFKIH